MHIATLVLLATLSCRQVAALPQRPQQIPFTGARAGTAQQPDSSDPLDWPYRPLPWGEVNILATTDTHGWLLGHQRNEPSFSGDWGDFYSFAHRLKDQARLRGVDLLLVDSGDRVDGNGLVDAEPSPLPKGSTALDIFSQVPYDVVTTGNHELYKFEVAKYAGEVMQSKFGERWVVSNVNISGSAGTDKEEEGRPFGNRVRKFRTEQGRKVTAFGPLFDFKAHAPGTTVQPPSRMVRSEWFLSAIASPPDFFLFVGHMSVDIEPDSEWREVVKAVREMHPRVPILIFGGHHHVRQCARYDEYSMGLAAGRYMETIGFMSISGLNETEERAPTFRRRYLDQNRNTYAYHAGKDFDTPTGLSLTSRLHRTAALFNLTETFGHAPQDYYLYRYPHTSPHSVLNLMTKEVLPKMVLDKSRRERGEYEPFMVLNSGSIRFDIFEGPFTRNDQWIILPFTNRFLYVPAVPRSIASKLLHYLNLVGEHGLVSSSSAAALSSPPLEGDAARAADSARLEHAYRRSVLAVQERSFCTLATSSDAPHWRMKRPSEGYVTLDPPGCGEEEDRFGDDTLHRPFKSAWQPVFVATDLPLLRQAGPEEDDDQDQRVDVVFFDFIKPDILSALNVLSGGAARWTEEDVKVYIEGMTANTLMEEYAKRYW
ncbi:hypothetical protein JCM10908_002448 [Rhodotorula pacifica]|uniref:Smn1p n=1 Tax=Rhodotorula pacifica TaxID=1495444 RepID=UPI003171A02D